MIDFNSIANILGEKSEIKNDIILKENLKGYCDPANVLMVIPKKESVKRLIHDFFDVGDGRDINLDYKAMPDSKDGFEIVSKYSMDYLSKIFNIIKDYDSVKIKMLRDYPLWVECDDFIFILAPRVEEEDKYE